MLFFLRHNVENTCIACSVVPRHFRIPEYWPRGHIMPRLHRNTCRPETCIPDEQLVSGIRIHILCRRTYVAGYKLLVRDTCWLYLGDIITIHLCHGRIVSLCIQQQTDDKPTTVLSPIQETCWRRQLDTSWYNFIRQHVSCKRGINGASIATVVVLRFNIGCLQFTCSIPNVLQFA